MAASYGAADFFGGLAARRTPATSVVVPAQALGLVVLGALVALAPSGHPTARDLGFGALAGACGGTGVFLLFRGLATGRMSVVAPITAVGAAVLPVAWGLATGERLSLLVLLGVVLSLVAVVLIAREPDARGEDEPATEAVGWAVGAGVGFGALFILLAQTNDDAGWWPLVGARVAAITVIGTGAVLTCSAIAPRRDAVADTAASGLLDVTANVLYLLAVRRGLLSLVAVLSSLYPAGTVLLARAVLHERIARMQAVGLGTALGGVVLIAAG